jgi:hypothetical protein
MLSRSRTVTGADGVPCHDGMKVAAGSPMASFRSSWAMPTSVLATDLVAE